MTATLVAGTIDLGFAFFHVLFWRLFGWPERLRGSGAINSAITQTMNVMLIYLFAAYGAGLIHFAQHPSGLAAPFALAGAGALILRAVLQFVYFPMRQWRSPLMAAVCVVAAVPHGMAAMAMWPVRL
jgi:hypothetical protein